MATATILALSVSTLATTAYAQSAAPPYDSKVSATPAVDGEIIVTARRRGEDIAKVPTTVTAIGADALRERSIATQADLQAAVPGLTIRETQTNNSLTFAIRGQTVDSFSGSATAVVNYVNEVPFTAGGVASYFDLESIQVLKGPQGTLFGRNATGGAILTATSRPGGELGGYVRLGIGNYDAKTAEFAFNAPLVRDAILLRVAGKLSRRDGYIKNVFSAPVYGGNDNSRLGALYSDAFRVSLLTKPSETFESLTVFQYERTKGNNSGTRIYSFNRCGDRAPGGQLLNCSVHFLYGPQMDQAFGFQGAWAGYLAVHPGANPGGIEGALSKQNNQLGFWDVDDDSPSIHRGRDWFVTNTSTLELGDDTKLKNIIGYSESRAVDSSGQTGEPFLIITNYDAGRPLTDPVNSLGNTVIGKSFTEEIQLQGKVASIEYIVGGFLQKINGTTIYPQSYFGLEPYAAPAASTAHWKSTESSKAIFAHVTVDLGEVAGLKGLKLSAGGRYAWTKITALHQPGSNFYPLTTPPFKDDRASWNVGLEYQAAPSVMFYATARESWRAGGINATTRPSVLDTSTGTLYANLDKFKSEVAQDFEVGAKFNDRLSGIPVHAYLSAYTMRVSNVQRVLFVDNPFTAAVDAIGITVGVPRARIKGVELDVGLKPADFLEVGFNGAYTKARYSRNKVSVFAASPFQQDFFYGPYADTPKWTGSAYAVLSLPIPEHVGALKLRADTYKQSSFFFSNLDNTINPGSKLPGYSLTNFRLDWTNVLGTGLGLGAWIKNAFNEEYYVGGLPLGTALGVNSANVGRPQMYGMDLSLKF